MPPAPGLHSGRVGCSQNGLVELPVHAAVAALEEDARRAARVEEPVLLAGDDRPDALERLLPVLGKLEALRLLPLACGVVRHEDLRPVERGRDAGEVAAAPRVADRELDRLAGERARGDLERAVVALEREQALLRSDEKLGHRLYPPLIDGMTWMRSSASSAVSSRPFSPLTKTLTCSRIARLLVEDPAGDRRVLALERAQDVAHGRALELELSPAARELGERGAQPHDRHDVDPRSHHRLDDERARELIDPQTSGTAEDRSRTLSGGRCYGSSSRTPWGAPYSSSFARNGCGGNASGPRTPEPFHSPTRAARARSPG